MAVAEKLDVSGFCAPIRTPFVPRAQSRDLLYAFLLPQILTELQLGWAEERGVSIAAASLPGVTFLAFLLKECFFYVSDAGAL